MGVFIGEKVLYRGSSTVYHDSGVSKKRAFNNAREATIGNGVYLTSKAENAVGYARRRSNNGKRGNPIIYEVVIKRMKLLDFREEEIVKRFLVDYEKRIAQELKEVEEPWFYINSLREILRLIDRDEVHSGNLKLISENVIDLFTKYCKSLGYDGLIAFEGGEGNYVGFHDSYVIFDPKRVRIKQEHQLV